MEWGWAGGATGHCSPGWEEWEQFLPANLTGGATGQCSAGWEQWGQFLPANLAALRAAGLGEPSRAILTMELEKGARKINFNFLTLALTLAF